MAEKSKMKKTTIYRLTTTSSFVSLIIFWILILKNIVNLSFNVIWFPSLLLYISFALFLKYALFRSDNILWFAIYLTFVATFNYVSVVFIKNNAYYPMYILFGAVDSLILTIIFKSLWQICLAIMLIFIGMPLFLISFSIIGIWWFLLIYAVCLVVGGLCVNFVYNFVESRYGKVWYW